MKRGKHIQSSGGSLSPSMRKEEKAARRSQKRASNRAWKKDQS